MADKDEPYITIKIEKDGVVINVRGALPIKWRHEFVDALRAAGFVVSVEQTITFEVKK